MNTTDIQNTQVLLKELLLNRQLATPEQIQEAVDYQQSDGGRLESHLFRFGYVSEPDLVEVLADQKGCDGVALSNLDIPPDVLDLISPETAWTHNVVPFRYDIATNTIEIACEDPADDLLQEELSKKLEGRNLKLCLALEVTLRSALIRHYRQPLPDSFSTKSFDTDSTTDNQRLEVEERHEIIDSVILESHGTDNLEVDNNLDTKAGCRLLVLSNNGGGRQSLGQLLIHQGYRLEWTDTLEEFIRLYREGKPHIILILTDESKTGVSRLVEQLVDQDISLATQPVFLVTSGTVSDQVGDLLRLGFEDVIQLENILDLLMIKLSRVRDRIMTEHSKRLELMRDLGTHGSLEDMNVVDLLQAMGPSGKTVRVSISGAGHHLSIILDMGRAIYAECGELAGAEAIYQALGWDRGIWSVDPIAESDLPLPNIVMTNEGILLEGCRRLDEAKRTEQGNEGNEAEPVPDYDPGNVTSKLNILFDQLS